MAEHVLTIEEVAARLGVSVEWVKKNVDLKTKEERQKLEEWKKEDVYKMCLLRRFADTIDFLLQMGVINEEQTIGEILKYIDSHPSPVR